jgi:hypothetical protein
MSYSIFQGACEKSDENSSSEHRSHHFRLPLVTHDDDSGDDSGTHQQTDYQRKFLSSDLNYSSDLNTNRVK